MKIDEMSHWKKITLEEAEANLLGSERLAS